MTTENLKQTLIELHAALEKTGPLDPELVHLLKVLDSDIQIKLVSHVEVPQITPPSPLPDASMPHPATTTEDAGLGTRAQALSARFAAQHPHLEPVLRELTDTLQRIGI